MAYFRLIKLVRGLVNVISILRYAKCNCCFRMLRDYVAKMRPIQQVCYFTTQDIVDNFLSRIKTFNLKQDVLFTYVHDYFNKLDSFAPKITRETIEGFLRKNIVAISFFSKLCYTPIFLTYFPLN